MWRTFSAAKRKGLAQYVCQIVPHQQRLVLVDRETRVPLARRQLQLQAPLPRRMTGDEVPELFVQAIPRILEADGFDRMRGDRDAQAGARHLDFVVVAHQYGGAISRRAGAHAVEIDEVDGIRPHPIRDARAQPGEDEHEMRISVQRFA